MRPSRGLAVMDQGKRAEQLDRVGVELRLPPGERRAEVEVARASRNPRLVVAVSLLASGLLLGVVLRAARLARFPLALLALGLGGDVRGDLLHEPIREPLAIGDVEVVAASVGAWQFEQAAEGTRRVSILVGEGEALAFAALLGLTRLPVVFVVLRDLGQPSVGGGDRFAVA